MWVVACTAGLLRGWQCSTSPKGNATTAGGAQEKLAAWVTVEGLLHPERRPLLLVGYEGLMVTV
jgi:hypothetical protein